MNLIEIVRAVAVDVGVPGVPSTVADAQGDVARIVSAVNAEYAALQAYRWINFLRQDFAFWTVEGFAVYDGSAAGKPVRDWVLEKPHLMIWDTSKDASTEGFLTPLYWDEFVEICQKGDKPPDKPKWVTVDSMGRLVLGPTPDKGTKNNEDGYRVRGDCYRTAAKMVADTDEPIFPEYHELLQHGAVMRYAKRDEAWDLYRAAGDDYRPILDAFNGLYKPQWLGPEKVA